MDSAFLGERARVVAAARSHIGTPYLDCANVRGVALDCATFIAMAYCDAGIEAPFKFGQYAPDWYMHGNAELFLDGVMERAIEIEQTAALPGDLVLYRFGRCYSHAGIVTDRGWPEIVHCFKQAKQVTIDNGDQGILQGRARRFFTRKAWAI